MTPEEILEGNKLMAEFLGWKTEDARKTIGFRYDLPVGWEYRFYDDIYDDYCLVKDNELSYINFPPQEMLFHCNWNWLMRVIEKMNNTTKWEEWDIGYLSALLVSAHLPEVYNECLKFIKSLNDERN